MTAASKTTRTRSLLVPACLAGVVLGILGMHTLAQHHAMPAHSASAMPMSPQVDAVPAPKLGESIAEVGDDHPMGDMVMLCTAMLVGAAASLLLSLRVSRLAKHFAGRQVGNPAIGALTAIRARAGPPYLWDFSVVRC